MTPSAQPEENDPAILWSDMVKFIRQLSHDLRNNLNAVELQSAYLAELATDDEMKSEIQHLREMVSDVGAALQRMTAGIGQTQPNAISYKASDFVDDLKQKIAQEMPAHTNKVAWEVGLKDATTLQIDPQLIEQAFLELFANAFQHERNGKAITAKASIENDRFVFELSEPKTQFEGSTENWGREPLRNTSQGHYGLGLNRVRRIVEAHDGDFRADYDPKSTTLKTTVTLPLKKSG